MKKYWKSIVILISIVLSLGTFYVNSALSAEDYPEYDIETLSGDPKEIESLVLDGTYMVSTFADYVNTDLKITSSGSTYNNPSFFDRIMSFYPAVIEELQEKHRSFMRGKHVIVNQYFEDNNFLAYANVDQKISSLGTNSFNFELSVLNKEADQVNSFELKVPDEGALHYILVEDVQLIAGKMYVITRNMIENKEEKHIYEIDVVDQKIIDHEAILQFSHSEQNVNSHVLIIESNPLAANDQIFLVKTEDTVEEDIESSRVIDSNQEIYSYDLAEKEIETVNVPGLSLDENQLIYVEESTLYFTRMEEQELIITPYQLGEDQLEQEIRIPLQAGTAYEPFQAPIIKVEEDKIYVVSTQINADSKGYVAVVDLNSGKTLFHGQIALDLASDEQKKYELYINDIYIK